MAIPTSGTPTLAQVLYAAMDTRSRTMGGALPGVVVDYNPGTETATVLLGVHRLLPTSDGETDVVEEQPAIQNVPVCWPRGHGYSLVGELEPGDPILLICMDRDISGWRRSGVPSEPADARLFSWSSCVAIPGLQSDETIFRSPTDAAALASAVDVILEALKQAPSGNGYGAAVKAALESLDTTASEIMRLDK